MKRTLLQSVACGALLVSLSGTVALAEGLPEPTVERLDNGLEVVVFEDSRLPTVHARVLLLSGASHEKPELAGLAILTAQTIFQSELSGASTGELRSSLARKGVEYAVNATHDYTVVSLRAPSAEWGEMIRALQQVSRPEAVLEPVFSESQRRLVLGNQQARSDLNAVADDHLFAELYGVHPYARPVRGDDRSVASITADDVRAFHRDHWRPNNTVLIVAGDVDAGEVIDAARRDLADWERAEIPVRVLAGEPFQETKIRLVARPNLANATVRIALPAVRRGLGDYVAMQAAVQIFAGDRFDSRLAKEMRARWGDAVQVTPTFSSGRDGGSLALSTLVPADDLSGAINAVRTVLGEFQQSGPTEEELEAAKTYLRGAHRFRLQTPGAVASQWLQLRVYGKPRATLDDYESRVDALTLEDVRRVASSALAPDPAAISVVASRDPAEQSLRTLGRVELVAFTARSGSVPAPDARTEFGIAEASPANEASADSLIQLVVEAHGGTASIEAVESWKITGKLSSFLTGAEVTGDFAEIAQLPDRRRIDMVIAGNRITRAMMGDRGWASSQGQIVDMSIEETEAMWRVSMSDPLMILGLIGSDTTDVRYGGTEERGGRTVAILQWIRDEGAPARIYFDAETHILQALEQPEPSPTGRGEVNVLRFYGDPRNVASIVYPFRVTMLINGARAFEQNVAELEIDAPVSDEIFRRPVQ